MSDQTTTDAPVVTPELADALKAAGWREPKAKKERPAKDDMPAFRRLYVRKGVLHLVQDRLIYGVPEKEGQASGLKDGSVVRFLAHNADDGTCDIEANDDMFTWPARPDLQG